MCGFRSFWLQGEDVTLQIQVVLGKGGLMATVRILKQTLGSNSAFLPLPGSLIVFPSTLFLSLCFSPSTFSKREAVAGWLS